MNSADAYGHSKHWIKDSAGRHTNIAAFLDWPDFESDDEVWFGVVDV